MKDAPGKPENSGDISVFITIEMTLPDGKKVRKTLGGSRPDNGCDQIHFPPEDNSTRFRFGQPRQMTNDERALHAMCLSALEQVSAKLLP